MQFAQLFHVPIKLQKITFDSQVYLVIKSKVTL